MFFNHLKQIFGNEKAGLIEYIEKYGFYEGGSVNNEFRADPLIIWSTLTGIGTFKENRSSKDILIEKLNISLDNLHTNRSLINQFKEEILKKYKDKDQKTLQKLNQEQKFAEDSEQNIRESIHKLEQMIQQKKELFETLLL